MTPYAKMSKRDRAAINNQRRNTWDFKPVTRIKPSAKAYNRKKVKHEY